MAIDLKTILADGELLVRSGADPDGITKAALAADAAFTGTYAPLASRVVKRKTADESVSNTTLQDDDHLNFAIGASEIWVVMFHLFVKNAAATGDFKVALTVPAGATGETAVHGASTNTTSGDSTLKNQSFTGLTTGLAVGIPASSAVDSYVIYSACIENSTNAGTVQLVWAQNSTDGSNATVVKEGSFMVADRVS